MIYAKRSKKLFFCIAALVIVVCTLLSTMMCSTKAFAAERRVNYAETDVLDDLRSSEGFSLLDYPYSILEDKVEIINFVEYCYSYKANMQDNFGLYVYLYNPTGKNIDVKSKANMIQIATAYDDNGLPSNYEKFNLEFCSKSEEVNYKNLFYKFKVVDRKIDGKYFCDRVNSNQRRYDISGIELITYESDLAKEYSVGGTYLFTGYAKGYGPDENAESNLTCEVNQLETISLETHSTYYRTGEYVKDHRHDLTSVYFAVPNRFFEEYGKLQRIKAEWYEYETTPICITSSNTVYKMLYPYLGKYTNESEGNDLQLYTGYQRLSGGSGHYDSYNWAYNCDYTTAINISCKRISYLFSTNGSAISNYVLSSERLKEYIETYDKSFSDGYINVPGKSISHDLFEKTLSEDRTAVTYVGDDIHHKLVDFDANNTFDMLNYDETHSGWYKFFAGLFGLGPNDVDKSYKGISPIKIVTEEDMKKDNLSSTLLIDGSEEAIEEFRTFYNESTQNNKTVVLFRFAQTDYMNLPVIAYNDAKGDMISSGYGKDTYVIKESVFMNFDIIQLTFNKEGVYTVIPVVNNPIDIYNDITVPDNSGLAWWEILLIIIFLILLLIVLWPILPQIINALIWLILLPFKLIGGLFRKLNEKRKARKLEKEEMKLEEKRYKRLESLAKRDKWSKEEYR